ASWRPRPKSLKPDPRSMRIRPPLAIVHRSRIRTSAFRSLILPLGAFLIACHKDSKTGPKSGVPTAVQVVSGDAQVGTVAQVLANPIVVRVLDAAGKPVQGQ